ncbi:hypothetical protein BHF71_03875 [Vulcanibacillus modesticaldus]|uniref:Uncharacterized protein n=1 Tax=Vulcanibacillus modesticaldus TaxID=337097 RepID=A0A1D2YSI9_9BACI|nr:hypothetical protein BHF71_03875 [Vulcanibacillus modesticaldus]
MEIIAYIFSYFTIVILLLHFTRLVALRALKKNYTLKEIKLIVWNYLIGFIITLTIFTIFIFLYHFGVIFSATLLYLSLIFGTLWLLGIFYLIIKLF